MDIGSCQHMGMISNQNCILSRSRPRVISVPKNAVWVVWGSFQRILFYVTFHLSLRTYLDDILTHSSNIEEHHCHLTTVFEGLQSVGLTLHGGKCNIGVHEVRYLGHIF